MIKITQNYRMNEPLSIYETQEKEEEGIIYNQTFEGPLCIEINMPNSEGDEISRNDFTSISSIPTKIVNMHQLKEPSLEDNAANLKEGHIPKLLSEEEYTEFEKEYLIERHKSSSNPDYNEQIKLDKKKKINDGSKSSIEFDITKKILERYQLVCLKGSLYLYEENKGCYFELQDYEIRTLVRTGWSAKIEALLSKSRVDDIIDRLKSYAEIQISEDDFDLYPQLINFNNCVIDVETLQTLKHSSKYRFTSFINANYFEKVENGENFLRFIDQCTNGDENMIRQIQEVIGYTIGNYTNAKKMFVLIGKPHTGKSTILELLTEIIGESYTSNVPLHELSGRFSLADLFKKKLNVCGELNDGILKNINVIKSITGNDRLRADLKYRDPINFINKAKVMMAGNVMPQIQTIDNTSAFTDRILFLVFKNTIPADKRDYSLKEKLILEKDFIVQWAIEGLYRLLLNNFVFTESLDSIEFKNQYQEDIGNIMDFINVMCKIDPKNGDLKVHKRDLYTAYLSYGRDNCHNILNKKEFFNEIKKLPVKPAKFRYKKSSPLDGFLGIALNEGHSLY